VAGQAFALDLGSDSALLVWQSVRDLASTAVGDKVTLIGGLMVDLHARRAGVVMPRPTVDVDVLVDYQAERSALSSVARALGSHGFSLSDQGQFGFRYRHADGRKLDLMVADHLPSRMEPRLGRRPALPVPGGAQAIRRRDTYRLRFDSGAAAAVGVPDSTGALVVKSAAYLADNRDRDRHLDDAAVLLASAGDVSEIHYRELSMNDRKRLGVLTEQLADSSHRSWAALGASDRRRGVTNVHLIAQRLEWERRG